MEEGAKAGSKTKLPAGGAEAGGELPADELSDLPAKVKPPVGTGGGAGSLLFSSVFFG